MPPHPTTSLFLAAVLLLCGCASRRGKGEMGHFILQQAVKQGVHPQTTNNLPSLTGKWRYYKRELTLVSAPERFPDFRAFLDQAFGPPGRESPRSAWYADETILLCVSCNYFEEKTHLQIRPERIAQP